MRTLVFLSGMARNMRNSGTFRKGRFGVRGPRGRILDIAAPVSGLFWGSLKCSPRMRCLYAAHHALQRIDFASEPMAQSLSWNNFPTGRSSTRASSSASKVDGKKTTFSTVLIVLRLTPTASANAACVRPSRSLSYLRVLRRRSRTSGAQFQRRETDERCRNHRRGYHPHRVERTGRICQF